MSKLILLASFGYLASTLLLLARMKGYWVTLPRAIPIVLASVATTIHGVLLWLTVIDTSGINIGLGVSLSLAGWLSALLVLASSMSKPMESLGLLIFPFSLITMWLTAILPPPHPLAHGIGIHVLSSLLAYTLLGLAAAQAALVMVQERRLKQRQWQGVFGALPALAVMERTLFEWLVAGFVLLSFALLTGVLYVDNFLGQHLAHKTLFTLATWVMVATLLIGHWRLGWRGQRAARLTLWGYAMLVVGFAGSQFVLEVLLGISA